jgi:hypothetical protein
VCLEPPCGGRLHRFIVISWNSGHSQCMRPPPALPPDPPTQTHKQTIFHKQTISFPCTRRILYLPTFDKLSNECGNWYECGNWFYGWRMGSSFIKFKPKWVQQRETARQQHTSSRCLSACNNHVRACVHSPNLCMTYHKSKL